MQSRKVFPFSFFSLFPFFFPFEEQRRVSQVRLYLLIWDLIRVLEEVRLNKFEGWRKKGVKGQIKKRCSSSFSSTSLGNYR